MTEPNVQSQTQSQIPPRPQASRDGSVSSSNSGGTQVVGAAAGFLAKITRSPSRRHKPLGSNGSVDGALAGPSTATPPRPRTRPSYARTVTAPPAPVVPVTLNAIRADILSRADSDTGLSTTDNKMLPLPIGSIAPTYNAGGTNRVPLSRVSSNVSGGTMSQALTPPKAETMLPAKRMSLQLSH